LLGGIWHVGDLGLSQLADDIINNEIYGVIPYIAPEIFKGAKFSKESDIYSLGMIMWELTTGCRPFANIEHDANLIYEIIDGKRPEITNDTPECFANLMKQCWDSVPSKRPTISQFQSFINKWYYKIPSNNHIYPKFRVEKDIIETFKQAEKKRLELIQSKKLGPEFSQKSHSKAIYTSRALSSLISNKSSSSAMMHNSMKQGIRRIIKKI
jgi:serine/threonine protein kinase